MIPKFNLEKIMSLIVAAILIVIVCINGIQVVCRYVLNYSFPWVIEVSILLFMWMVFLGATVAVKKNEHIRVVFLEEKLPLKKRISLDIFVNICVIAFLILLVIKGMEAVHGRMGIMFTGVRLSTAYAYMAVPVCSALMVFYMIKKIINKFLKVKPENKDLQSNKRRGK